MIKYFLQNLQERLFDFFILISYILIFASFLSSSKSASLYLELLDYYVRIYICLFLIWRFNPLRSNFEFTDLDRKIAFNAGLIILTTTYLNKYLNYLKTTIKNTFHKNTN